MKTNILTVIVLIIFSTLFVGCDKKAHEENQKNHKSDARSFEYGGGVWNSTEYAIIEKTIDDCEYIIIFGVNTSNIIHKANCENYIHQK